MDRRDRIESLLGEERITGAMERTWDYHGFRAQAATTLALLEIADALESLAFAIAASESRRDQVDELRER